MSTQEKLNLSMRSLRKIRAMTKGAPDDEVYEEADSTIRQIEKPDEPVVCDPDDEPNILKFPA